MSDAISIRVAEEGDHDVVRDFLAVYYYPEEPITNAHPQPGHTKDDEHFTMSHLKKETILMATNKENGEIVGVLVAGPLYLGDVEGMIELAKKAESKKWADISLFLAYIEKKASVLKRLNVSSSLHVHVVAVNSTYRGQGIGQKLFNACFDNAKRLDHPIVSADCTSIYTNNICDRLGMDCISTVTYAEYNEFIDEKLFTPTEPNVEIKTYVKKIDD
ncbi:CLUMA_CG019579, isoform A [Clunio marinus]|uniref:aralkylamine N-acetyltransferase n=1 Tax=Clunio marinus TaxID=568069 RepID=A0A1J1J6G6_9DIPT|nr:CLUMA_CG019579, isoform A [Clunio marinus]